ncbi:MAG: hypothetical protein JWP44_409 [Mucilaginibacter sp.]|nr:hypothetical protein [Mucilaginibacter sp.]
MRIKIARLLLIFFLAQSTQLGEVFKAPLLFVHFFQHKKLYPETTVYGFIKMHYIDKTVIDADYAQDMQLPFKAIDNHFLTIQLSLPPAFIKINTSISSCNNIKILYPPNAYACSVINKIFQPPKLA